MFDCTYCGHSEMVHGNYVGACLHGQMKPKDGLDCDCPRMDHKPEIELSDDEKESLGVGWCGPCEQGTLDVEECRCAELLWPAVERIVAARLAPARALADDLSDEVEELREDVPPVGPARVAHLYRTAGLSDARDRLLAALAPLIRPVTPTDTEATP